MVSVRTGKVSEKRDFRPADHFIQKPSLNSHARSPKNSNLANRYRLKMFNFFQWKIWWTKHLYFSGQKTMNTKKICHNEGNTDKKKSNDQGYLQSYAPLPVSQRFSLLSAAGENLKDILTKNSYAPYLATIWNQGRGHTTVNTSDNSCHLWNCYCEAHSASFVGLWAFFRS